jgi:amino acid transporter
MGGPVTYIENFTGRSSLAGMAGWTFIVAYIGTTAMYAYAFGDYFVLLIGVESVSGVPLRPFLSVLLVAVLVGPNIAGAHISGTMQDLLDVPKLAILLLFSVVGLYFGYTNSTLQSGFSSLSVSTLTATALAFVAFEGWELLLFDQDSIEDPTETVRKAIPIAIVVATSIYMMVAAVTTNVL